MAKLSYESIQSALATMTGWSVVDRELVKTYRLPTFPEGIAFVDRVAALAEAAGHHPDIDIRYSSVTLRLSTHDEGGITEKDINLAQRIEAVA